MYLALLPTAQTRSRVKQPIGVGQAILGCLNGTAQRGEIE
jgi:hypothetical protein